MAKFFVPSKYQLDIFNWIKNGTGDAMVNAVAGSGKTTTIVQAANLIKTDGLFCAFNKHIAETLREKLAGTRMRATTIHAFGYSIVARELAKRGTLTVKDDKYAKIATKYAEMFAEPELRMAANLVGKEHSEARRQAKHTIKARGRALAKLADMVRLTRTLSSDLDAVRSLMTTFDITTDGPAGDAFVLGNLRRVLDEGIDLAEQARLIDYTDMIWLPLVLKLHVPKYGFVFVDECQDLNACQRDLILRARGEGGRFLLVGDDHQAIMGFAGADTRSFWNIQEKLGATVLPLSICYRCPSSHVAVAKELVPQIEASPTAREGVIADMFLADAPKAIERGDLVMCRMTAPLISLCLRLIRSGKPAQVRGRDIAAQLIELTETIEEIANTFPPVTFLEALSRWETAQIDRLAELDDADARIERVQDMAEALRVCYSEWGSDMKSRIAGIFSDSGAAIWLSTVHKAKGLEADRAFILFPRSMPLTRKGQTPEQFQQELNILYVALTRGKSYMGFILKDGEPRGNSPLAFLGELAFPQATEKEEF